MLATGAGAQTDGTKGKEADQSALEQTRLQGQLTIDRQRLRKPVDLPTAYHEAQRRVTQGDKPAWLQCDAGLTEAVPPPWTPVAVDGPSVNVLGRTYRFADSGLPQAIDSDSTSLLARPVRLLATVDGRPVEVQGGKLRLESTKKREAALSSRSRLGGLDLQVSVSVEYDGFARFDTVLSGAQPANLDQLVLEIPLRAQCASHYAHDMQGVVPLSKKNPTLLFESGGHGGALPAEALTLTFTPQVLLSNGRVGLSFVTASDQGWSVADRRKMIEVVRRDDGVVLRVRFVDRRVRLERPLRLSWGLTALPSRPRPTWSAYETFNSAQWGSAGQFLATALRRGAGGETDTPLDRAARAGLKVVIIHQEWTEMQGYPGTLREENATRLRRVVEEAHRRHLKVVAYLGQEISESFPEWERFGASLVRLPLLGGRRRSDPPAESYRPCANAVYADFLAYKTRELIRQFDIDGIFLDGQPAISPCLNTDHGHGYRTESGEWRATFDVFEVRRMTQRLYALFHGLEKPNGVLVLHSGWGWNPAFSFGDYRLAGEFEVYRHKMHPDLSLMEILSPDYFRAVYDPAVNGLPLAWMSKPDRGGLTYAQDRAVSLLHGVMQRARWPQFGSDIPARGAPQAGSDGGGLDTAWKIWQIFGRFNPHGARWHPYWDDHSALSVQPAAIRVSYYARPGDGLLAVVSNLGRSPQTAVVSFDLQGLRLDAERIVARDAMSDTPLALDGNRLSLDLKPESCRLVLVGKRP
jgi:Glycoside hydrolase 123, N-terminal domain